MLDKLMQELNLTIPEMRKAAAVPAEFNPTMENCSVFKFKTGLIFIVGGTQS